MALHCQESQLAPVSSPYCLLGQLDPVLFSGSYRSPKRQAAERCLSSSPSLQSGIRSGPERGLQEAEAALNKRYTPSEVTL